MRVTPTLASVYVAERTQQGERGKNRFHFRMDNMLIENVAYKGVHILEKCFMSVKNRIYSLPVHVHTHQFDL